MGKGKSEQWIQSGLVCMPRSLLEGACFKETQENNETMMKEAGST